MAKLTKKEYEDLIKSTTKAVLEQKGLTEVVRKLKFNEKPIDEMDKYEKTMRFFQAKMDNNRAEVAKYCGGKVKDLSGNTSGSGLELLPTEFHSDIIDRVKADPRALRNLCTVVPVTYRNGTWPVGATGISLSYESSDTNPITATSPTFSSLPYSVTRLDGYTAISRDLLSDSPVDLYNYLAKQYAKAFVKQENLSIMTGTGTNQPTGIVNTGSIVSVASANAGTTNVLTCDDLVQLPFNVDVTWRDGGAYFVNTSIVRQMKLFKDNQGRYLWDNGDVQAGVPASFNGYPVYEFSAIFPSNLTVNSKTTCTEAVFGNLEYYYFFDKMEMGSEINTQSDQAFKNHEALVKMWERIDGKLSIPASFALLTGFLA
ncbi:phage major capsid protein [Clostridium pasteurianum]|uniref:Phage major capsid protein, HK97 family n=1 Tax=Clostridium pasteurianum BC1 TaxID=86416 RepID=R4K128_CLOPA|nr:phage major capsid protein [Clostridium pasteurianum]AGK96797.1 phage major capsid protein, HK97 family [Clostridium pasteurianum BC1]